VYLQVVDGLSPAERVGYALWSVAAFPEALFRSMQDRRRRIVAPRIRCSDVVVDEARGSVSGLPLGASLHDVLVVLGPGLVDPPPAGNQPSPTLPGGLESPPGHQPGRWIARVAYADALVYVSADCGVYAIYVWRKDTTTARGVRLGDSRARVKARYPELECGEVPGGLGYPRRVYCRGAVGAHHLWLGEDPVRTVAIALSRM
jgi:hypothetical protein